MPIIKSAKKRVKVSAKATARNVRTKRAMREALKAFAKAVEAGKKDQITEALGKAVSTIDTAAKKAVIHKNKAARFKARLAAQANSAGAKISPRPKATSRRPKTKTAKAKKPASS